NHGSLRAQAVANERGRQRIADEQREGWTGVSELAHAIGGEAAGGDEQTFGHAFGFDACTELADRIATDIAATGAHADQNLDRAARARRAADQVNALAGALDALDVSVTDALEVKTRQLLGA